MMVTVAGVFRHGKIELERAPIDAHDNDHVLVTFPESEPVQRKPEQLHGAWKERFSVEPDIEAILKDVRREWTAELDDF